MRKALALAAGVIILAAVNWTIYGRERHLAEGRVVLLELAPVDPRSLMQGDFMALRFQLENSIYGGRGEVDDGRVVVRVDERGVGSFVRRDDGTPLAEGEVALRYRVRAGRVKFATNAFFFEEGRAAEYQRARFGEFRVARSGDLLLTGLRGRDVEPLGRPAR
jgi:uncharacterized membrane-anchored protein